MKIGSISGLEYRVEDLETTVKFYESLGFRMGKREDGQATCYVNWFWLRFVEDADAAGPGHPLYLKVADIDDFYGEVVAHGYTPSTEPRRKRTGGPREFVLEDADGNQLTFFTK